MQRYEILLFDADNTLFDFTRAEENAFRETADAAGLDFSDALYHQYSSINDGLWKRLEQKEITLDFLKLERFRVLLTETGRADDEETLTLAKFMRDTYMNALAGQACLIDGAEETCRALAPDYRMYIITNGISKIQRSRFEKSALTPYFAGMFVSEELGVSKPSSAYFEKVFDALGNPDKAKVLVIGDSLTSDCDGATDFGLDFCRFNPKGEPDNGRVFPYTVKKLSEIKTLLDERNGRQI